MEYQRYYGRRWKRKVQNYAPNVYSFVFSLFLDPLRICLSTISLLEVAESYYEKQGFQQIRKDHYDGYDLDIYEKIYSSSVYKTNTIILRNQKHHFHYYTSNHKATYD